MYEGRYEISDTLCFVLGNSTAQITPHRTHACAHFSLCVSHFFQCTCIGSRCLSDSVSLSKIKSLLGVPELSAFLPVLTSSTTSKTPVLLRSGVDRLATWPIRLQTQAMSPSSAPTSAASTRRSTFRPERAASTQRMT